MINRCRLRPPYGGAHISSISASSSSLSEAGPVVGAFIAGPIGALIGRVLAGTIEAVTTTKAAPGAGKKKSTAKKSGLAGHKQGKVAAAPPTLPPTTKALSIKPPRKLRTKKQ